MKSDMQCVNVAISSAAVKNEKFVGFRLALPDLPLRHLPMTKLTRLTSLIILAITLISLEVAWSEAVGVSQTAETKKTLEQSILI